MDISFAWTTPALVTGNKSVTRRQWGAPYAARFRCGQVVTALNRQRRYKGQVVGAIRLTADPVLESTADAPPSDWEAEGFEFLTRIGAKVDKLEPAVLWRAWHWRAHATSMYVVRFELVTLTEFGKALARSYTIAA